MRSSIEGSAARCLARSVRPVRHPHTPPVSRPVVASSACARWPRSRTSRACPRASFAAELRCRRAVRGSAAASAAWPAARCAATASARRPSRCSVPAPVPAGEAHPADALSRRRPPRPRRPSPAPSRRSAAGGGTPSGPRHVGPCRLGISSDSASWAHRSRASAAISRAPWDSNSAAAERATVSASSSSRRSTRASA